MGFTGQLVERAGEPLGDLAAVDEKNGGVASANDFEQARVNGVPDGDALGRLRCRAAGNLFLLAEARHVFDGNFDAQLELLAGAGVDDGDGAIAKRGSASGDVRGPGGLRDGCVRGSPSRIALHHPADSSGTGSKPGYSSGNLGIFPGPCVSTPPRKRATSSRGRCVAERPMRCKTAFGQGFQALESERHVRAALGGHQRVNLIDDDGVYSAQGF
jgi:hypothetical protein